MDWSEDTERSTKISKVVEVEVMGLPVAAIGSRGRYPKWPEALVEYAFKGEREEALKAARAALSLVVDEGIKNFGVGGFAAWIENDGVREGYDADGNLIIPESY